MTANVTELPRAGRHTEGPDIAEIKASQARSKRHSQRITNAGIAVSIFWVLLCLIYIHSTLGWSFGSQMLAHELGALVAGMAAPLAFLWLAMAYFRRGYDVRDHTEALRRQLEMLTYPAEEAEARISQVSEALRKQAEELSRASDKATIDIGQLSSALREQTEALSEVSEKASGEAVSLKEAISGQTKSLTDLADRFADQSRNMEGSVERQAEELEKQRHTPSNSPMKFAPRYVYRPPN